LVGTPLFTDKATASCERIAYARVFVKTKADKAMQNKVTLQIEEGEDIELE